MYYISCDKVGQGFCVYNETQQYFTYIVILSFCPCGKPLVPNATAPQKNTLTFRRTVTIFITNPH